jgi:two-component system, LuxR family, sensor kinase FixL
MLATNVYFSFGQLPLSFGPPEASNLPASVRLMAISGKAMGRAFLDKHVERLIKRHSRSKFLSLSLIALLVSTILLLDLLIPQASLGILYSIPMLLGAVALPEREIALLALFCAILSWWGDPSASRIDGSLYFFFSFISYLAEAYFVTMLLRNHRLVAANLNAIEQEQAMRREAEEQLTTLVESSPAGILTLDEEGRVLAANAAAHRLFEISDSQALKGRTMLDYLPVLVHALHLDVSGEPFHTAAQCQATKQNGEIFLAHAWFSTYRYAGKLRLAAIFIDASEEMRYREEQSLKQLSSSLRITAAAVSHEIRNFCSAISILCSERRRRQPFVVDDEMECLEGLAKGLENVAALDLRCAAQEAVPEITLQRVFENLRIIVGPDWQEIGGSIEWEIPERPSRVLADPHGLLQTFLNLSRNSCRAVSQCTVRVLTITVSEDDHKTTVRFRDTGPGVHEPQRLFQPFQELAEVTGMGLYVSRAILRSYGGELRYEQESDGACFVVELQTV